MSTTRRQWYLPWIQNNIEDFFLNGTQAEKGGKLYFTVLTDDGDGDISTKWSDIMTLIAAVFRVSLSSAVTNVATFPLPSSAATLVCRQSEGKCAVVEIFSCDDVMMLYTI